MLDWLEQHAFSNSRFAPPTPLTSIHYTLKLSDNVMLITIKRKHSEWNLLSQLRFPQLSHVLQMLNIYLKKHFRAYNAPPSGALV